jgi:hypothetical protein
MADTAPREETPTVAVKHFTGLQDYLGPQMQKGKFVLLGVETHFVEQSAGVSVQRQSARQKLAKLTPGQFEELSTDVFDEMNRRLANREDGTLSSLIIPC